MLSHRLLRFVLILIIMTSFVGAACTSGPEVPSYYEQATVIPGPDPLSATPQSNPDWTPDEIAVLGSLSLGSLPPLPPDPSNGVADDPQAAALGHHLFFDARLSANNQVACASCHQPDLMFTDGLPRSFGTRTTRRNAMTIVGAAYSPWLLRDGHKDSLWAQAVEPVEHPDEHGTTRLHAVHLVRQDQNYRQLYERVFDPLPEVLANFERFPDGGGPVEYARYRQNWVSMRPEDQQIATEILANLGKAIAAYERLIQPGPSRFDEYVEALIIGDEAKMATALTADEVAGLRLFIGPATCIQCHHGPLFTDNRFHHTGVPNPAGAVPDTGRAGGITKLIADDFNCLGPYSDAETAECADLQSIEGNADDLTAAFRTPTLRNVAETKPYMHTGQFATLPDVLEHYRQAPPGPAGATELRPLDLSDAELRQLEAFLLTLSGPLAVAPELLQPPSD